MATTRFRVNRRLRQRYAVNGIVQGVGFRPFVYKLAHRLNLSGFISNTGAGVLIETEGPETVLEQFHRALLDELPPLAEITDLSVQNIRPQNSDLFEIRDSQTSQANQTLISPDIAICEDCQRELFDTEDRRFLYPFINCTNCGPRFTIIHKIPYDRPATTMAKFKMCRNCQAEYDNPLNRRFHAQPNACPDCGPQVWLENGSAGELAAKGNDSFVPAIRVLKSGQILAIKGLGGFHLAVDATNEKAVASLRRRKNREEKPLAVMVADREALEQLAECSSEEYELLSSPQRPIVLLKRKENSPTADAVAPGNRRLGIMLPYTPLHYILLRQLDQSLPTGHRAVLVMTSANRSEEPIVISNEDARERLADIADAYLMHNRDILVRADDSVAAVFDSVPSFIRRSRGYVPRPVFVSAEDGPVVLGCGAELKSTVCLLKDRRAFLSQHIGDLENFRATRFFEQTTEHMQEILAAPAEAFVCDMHPGYFSTQWAEQQQMPLIKVQHHHAHLAAVLAEHQHPGPAIGIILDGTGYGTDGTIWGGEILAGNFSEVQRLASLETMPLPGGDAAIREPWRIALAYLYTAFGKDIPELSFLHQHPADIIFQMIDKKINLFQTSSCGRLFDAVAAMAGGRPVIRYEGQAAIEMMQQSDPLEQNIFPFEMEFPRIPLTGLIRHIAEAARDGMGLARVGARFHNTLIHMFKAAAKEAARITGLNTVVLSGGVFQNEILLNGLNRILQKDGFQVLLHRQVPANDGGLALGQAMIGRQLLTESKVEVRFVDHAEGRAK